MEGALPGIEPDRDAIAEDVAAMLSPSRRKELARDVLDRQAPTGTERVIREAHDEIERSQQRIDNMREQRAQLGKLQRSRRAAVDQDIARQHEAIERWSARAEMIVASPPLAAEGVQTETSAPPDLHDVRVAFIEPDENLRRALGDRPSCFEAREAWARKAVELVGVAAPTLDPAPGPASMDDFGIDI